MKCTQKNPGLRYHDCASLLLDLKRSLVDPEGDFVVLGAAGGDTDRTMVMSTAELEQVTGQRGAPVTDDDDYDDDYDDDDDEDEEDEDERLRGRRQGQYDRKGQEEKRCESGHEADHAYPDDRGGRGDRSARAFPRGECGRIFLRSGYRGDKGRDCKSAGCPGHDLRGG